MNIVYVNHGDGKSYAFYVPNELVPYIKKGDIVVVETMYGIKTGECQTGIINGDGAIDKAVMDGAYQPIKPVIGKLFPELKSVIMKNMQIAIAQAFSEPSDEFPF